MHRVFLEVRSACRLMRRQPAFSLFVILTLGVGIGAATAEPSPPTCPPGEPGAPIPPS